MNHEIKGEIAQFVRLEFEPGEFAWASKGSLMSYSRDIEWVLRVPGGASGAVRRSLSGEGLALTHLSTRQPDQFALLAANAPGHIEEWDLTDGPLVTTRGAFLAAWGKHVDISVTVARRARSALFGGAGLFLQRVSGQGVVLFHGCGDLVDRRLEDGEQLLVSSGNLVAFSDQVDYDIQGVGGCRKMLFGGEGLFMTRLTGPGRIILQSLKREATKPSGGAAPA